METYGFRGFWQTPKCQPPYKPEENQGKAEVSRVLGSPKATIKYLHAMACAVGIIHKEYIKLFIQTLYATASAVGIINKDDIKLFIKSLYAARFVGRSINQ